MERKRKNNKIEFPSKLVGWLNVWDIETEQASQLHVDGGHPVALWEPFFCVLRQDLKTFVCHRSEEDVEDITGFRSVPCVRIDDGKREFDKRWGYAALESIKENAVQHCLSLKVSSERLFKTKLLDTSFNESLPDTSYEKLVGERDRRGSVPLVPQAVEEDSVAMETTSTPSRFTNFLIRKGFKSNLKRTKSSTKLDKKKTYLNVPDNDSGTFVGSLKRTMSLGRLTRKRTRTKSSDANSNHQHPLSIISSRLKNSQSHESLLVNNSTMHSIDLTATDIEVKPLHPSIMGQDHCFQVSTNHGSKYISCRTAEEREKWIESLRKTTHPHQERNRRTENALKVWVVEAKNVSPKKRYYCEICLDKTLYARTSSKTKSEMLFWGEQFEFNNLPSIEFLTVNLYKEADKKKKKDRNMLLGYIKIPISEISNRQFVERWFTASSGTVGNKGKENKGELPLVRLKARYQTVHILPMDLYQDFIQYLSSDYLTLCEALEPLVNIRDKEDIATRMIHVMQKINKAKAFLSEVVMTEIIRLDNQHLTFRGNSIATKAMEAYLKLVGEKYLHDTLGDFVKTMIESDDDCEVDPTKVTSPQILQRHQMNLRMYCDMCWTKIITSFSFFPSELREVFASFRESCVNENKADLSDNLISASIFLRFLCPAVLSPSLFGLLQEFPPERAARNLTLIAKTVQTLANFTKFGGKEEFMTFMNDFVESEWGNMKDFLHKISSPDESSQYLEFDGYIDMGKELSVLHTLLVETLERATEGTMARLGKLPVILERITEDLKDPHVNQRKQKTNRHSQHYDNLANIQSHIGSTSPTELLRDMLRQCGESPDDMSIFSKKTATRQGSFDVGSSRMAADNLSTNDDYVTCRAFSTPQHHSHSVANVSVSTRKQRDELDVNKSWNQIVSAAEVINGDYIDLISFMDDDTHNSSMEMDQNMNGSQMSISQISTVASSGYQSFAGYSQSNSPVENPGHHDLSLDSAKSPPSNQVLPLSFANPMYKHSHGSTSSRATTSSPIGKASSSSSLSSNDEANTVKHCSPVRLDYVHTQSDPLRRLAPPLSSSSSSESVPDRTKHKSSPMHGSGNSLNGEGSVRHAHPLELRTSSPSLTYNGAYSSCSNSRTEVHSNYCNTLGSTPLRNHELSHSVDFTYMTHRYGDQLRRTATDSIISQRSSSPYNSAAGSLSPRGQLSPEDGNSRRLSSQNAVHMGIRSVQRRINEQEKTKQEYESEVAVLKQQLTEAQARLQQAEARLQEHESGTNQLIEEWHTRLEESEERMRKQQAEKDDQMKNIIQRLINVEDELRHEQEDMQILVSQKQKVIEAQERRIQSLDTANSKLVAALNQLKEHYNTSQSRNGMISPLKKKLSASDLSHFKTSSC